MKPTIIPGLRKDKRTELEQFFLITESYFVDSLFERYSPYILTSEASRLQRLARIMREIAGLEDAG